MTDKDKLEKLKKLSDAMYYAAGNLGPNVGSGERLRKTMKEYHQFIINEYHKEEPVSIDFEQELYKAFGQVKDFTLGMRIAKWFYTMGKNSQEPVSEDLKEAYESYTDERLTLLRPDIADMSCDRDTKMSFDIFDGSEVEAALYEGALWQKQQMMAKAVDATVHIDAGGYPYIPQIELYDYDKDIPLAKKGDKYKVILIKE